MSDKFTCIIKAIMGEISNISLIKDGDGNIGLDLNTMMKSHAHLFIIGDKIVLNGRYETVKEVSTNKSTEEIMYDICLFVRECLCGRDFWNDEWMTALESRGLVKVQVKTSKTYSY